MFLYKVKKLLINIFIVWKQKRDFFLERDFSGISNLYTIVAVGQACSNVSPSLALATLKLF